MFVTALFCVFFGLGLYFLLGKRKLKNFPPGPTGLPIIGNMHQLDQDAHKTFTELRKKYGDIFSVQLGSYRAVILNNPKLIKEAFSSNAFSGRPIALHIAEPETQIMRGIMFNKGHQWMEQRRFALKSLRDFGFKYGSRSMENLIQEEVKFLIDEFAASAGTPVCTHMRFNIAVINALWTVVTGVRFDLDDPKLKMIIRQLSENVTSSRSQGTLIFFPWLTKYFPNWSGKNTYVKNITPIYDMIKECVVSHEQSYEPGNNRDVIDCYLEEMKKPQPEKSSFGTDGVAHLVMSTYDLFLAGTETTSTTLTWICLLLSHHPEVQRKVNKEINDVVGTGRYPSIADRPKMPYCEATILETLRYITLLPIALLHSAMGDETFQGYDIPKDTLVIANQWFVDHDPQIWGDPKNFRPERMLSEEGKSLIRPESFMPFSIGKRVCPGEGLARDELFLFSTAILQRFEVGFVPGKPIPEIKTFPGAPVSVAIPHELQMRDRYK